MTVSLVPYDQSVEGASRSWVSAAALQRLKHQKVVFSILFVLLYIFIYICWPGAIPLYNRGSSMFPLDHFKGGLTCQSQEV